MSSPYDLFEATREAVDKFMADERAYRPICQGGTGGKCCDPDCEKCWPDPPSESEGASHG